MSIRFFLNYNLKSDGQNILRMPVTRHGMLLFVAYVAVWVAVKVGPCQGGSLTVSAQALSWRVDT